MMKVLTQKNIKITFHVVLLTKSTVVYIGENAEVRIYLSNSSGA